MSLDELFIYFFCSVCSSSSSNSGSIDTSLGTEFEVVTLLTKDQLDKANKDVHHKLLPKDFKVRKKIYRFKQRSITSQDLFFSTV